MKYIYVPVLFTLLITFSIVSIACDCIPGNFSDLVKSNDVIIAAVILEHDVIVSEDPFLRIGTKLKVLDDIRGNLNDSILFFVNGIGANCYSSIRQFEPNDTILTLSNRTEVSYPYKTTGNIPLIMCHLCGGTIYQIKQAKVFPKLKNKKFRKCIREYNKLKEKGKNSEANNYYRNNIQYPKLENCVSYQKQRKKIKRKI